MTGSRRALAALLLLGCLIPAGVRAADASGTASPSPASPAPAASAKIVPVAGIPWDISVQGRFLLAACTDLQGRLWASTEDTGGLWCYDPSAPAPGGWTHFAEKEGLGDDIICCLCGDRKGRLVAGGISHGLSIYNNKTKSFRKYDVGEGPLGGHVFALGVSPSGDLFACTDAGLCRHSESPERWSYFTRENGLPSDQVDSIAFSRKDGTMLVGSQADGIAMASPADRYSTWKLVKGPDFPPSSPAGTGIPSIEINAVWISSIDDSYYVGTPNGLARSADHGATWSYVRGKDWIDKPGGPGSAAPVKPGAPNPPLLREDFVSCLAEMDGRVVVGHQHGGYDVLQPGTLRPGGGGSAGPITFVLAEAGIVGSYGGGIRGIGTGSLAELKRAPALEASLPAPAAPPTDADLNRWIDRLAALHVPLAPGAGGYLEDDSVTQGCWVGRYGNQGAVLCAARSPFDHNFRTDPAFKITGTIGPRHQPGDSLRHWVQWVQAKDQEQRVLYDPICGYRREAEWDDHAETYPLTFDGPNLFICFEVREGVHRASLYFVNPNGQSDGEEALRDYLLELKPYRPRIEDADTAPTIARARVRQFWHGIYKSFWVKGPGKFYVRISRNSGINCILPGAFLDKLAGPACVSEDRAMPWMGGVRFRPEGVYLRGNKTAIAVEGDSGKGSSLGTPARLLWLLGNRCIVMGGGAEARRRDRVMAYRASLNASNGALSQYRWDLNVWSPIERAAFSRTMAVAHQSLSQANPIMKSLQY